MWALKNSFLVSMSTMYLNFDRRKTHLETVLHTLLICESQWSLLSMVIPKRWCSDTWSVFSPRGRDYYCINRGPLLGLEWHFWLYQITIVRLDFFSPVIVHQMTNNWNIFWHQLMMVVEKRRKMEMKAYICICGRFTVLCVFHCVRLCVHVCHCDSCVFAVLFLDFIHIAVTFLWFFCLLLWQVTMD